MSKYINAVFGGTPCQAEIDSKNILKKAGIMTQGRCAWIGPKGDTRTGLFIPVHKDAFSDIKEDTIYHFTINDVPFEVVKRDGVVRGIMCDTLLRVSFGEPISIVIGG